MLALVLIGSVAMAAALLLRTRDEPPHVEARIPQQAVPSEPARAAKSVADSTRQPQTLQHSNTSPQTTEATSKDIPLAFVTTPATRPLADTIIERVTKYPGGFARPRLMTLDDTEALRALCGNADFAMVSRRIAENELVQCQKWGIDLLEWKLGYQAVVLTAGPAADPIPLTPRDVFLALARRVPDPAEPSRLIDNPNATWHDVDARFDYRSIDVLAQPDATTRALFAQLVMEPGCETFPWIRRLKGDDRARYDDICHQLRSDGRYREVEVRGTFITQQLWSEPNQLVVLGYSYYAEHRTELLGTKLQGPPATLATLTDGTYPAARPVYVYAQGSHLTWASGARQLAEELSNMNAFGPRGYLRSQGLIPPDDLPRTIVRPQLPPTLDSLQH